MWRRVNLSVLFLLWSSIVLAEDCQSFRGPLSRSLKSLEEIKVTELREDSAATFWLPRELIFSGEGRQIVVLQNAFQIFCGLSFDEFSEENVERDLEVVGNLISFERMKAEEESKFHLPAGFYTPEFEKIEGEETARTIQFIIRTSTESFRVTLWMIALDREGLLKSFWENQPVFVKEAQPFETIENLALDMSPELSKNMDSFFAASSREKETDFEKFYREDFVIQSSGFDHWGYYREVVKPLENGGSIRFRYRRYDSFLHDPFQRHQRYPYWYYYP